MVEGTVWHVGQVAGGRRLEITMGRAGRQGRATAIVGSGTECSVKVGGELFPFCHVRHWYGGVWAM